MYRTCSFLIGYACLVLWGCSADKPVVPGLGARFFYYPKTNVYFDAHLLNYSYSLDSGRTWQSMQADSASTRPLSLGGEIEIKGSKEEPWEDNITHRSMYGGTLYNVLTRDTILLADNTIKEEKKPVTKLPAAEAPKKKKNIFQKIFGKKKNNS